MGIETDNRISDVSNGQEAFVRPNFQPGNVSGFQGAGFDSQQPGYEQRQGHAQGFNPRPSPPPFAGSALGGLPGFQRPYGQQETQNRFAKAAQALGEGTRAAWQHLFGNGPNAGGAQPGMPQFGMPQFGMPQFGMPHPWDVSTPYAPRYANNMQPGAMPFMGPLRTMNAILSGALGLAIGSFDPIAGVLAGLGMFAEGEMSAGFMRNMMGGFNLQPGMQQGAGYGMQHGAGYGMPWTMPWAVPWVPPFPDSHFGAFSNDWIGFMPTLATMMFLQNAYQTGLHNPMSPTPTGGFEQNNSARFSAGRDGQPRDMAAEGGPHADGDSAFPEHNLGPWQEVFWVHPDMTQSEVAQTYRELREGIITRVGDEALKKHVLKQLSERYRDALEYFAEHGAPKAPQD